MQSGSHNSLNSYRTTLKHFEGFVKKQQHDLLEIISEIKCADCDCFPAECKESKSAKECPNCTWEECCCWSTIQKRA